MLSLVIRAGIVGGAVYYSRALGVWGSTEETELLYNNVKNEIRPRAQMLERQLPFDVPALPQTGEVRFLAKHYYNEGVKGTFHFIEMLPCYAGQTVKKAKDTFEEFAKSPEPSKESGGADKK